MQSPKQNYYPNVKQTWSLVGIFILVSLVVGLIVLPIQSISSSLNLFSEAVTKGFIQLASYIATGLFTIWFGFREKDRFVKNWKFKYTSVSLEVYLFLFIATIALSILLEPLIELIPAPEFLKTIFEQIMLELMSNPVLAFINVAIAAAFIEEWLCRGIILEGLLKHYKSDPYKAILYSAFIFGFIHLNPWQFVSGFIAGLLLAWTYYKTNSLWPCIFIHFINNSSACIIYFITNDIDFTTRNLFDSSGSYLICLACCALILVFSLLRLNRIFKNSSQIQSVL